MGAWLGKITHTTLQTFVHCNLLTLCLTLKQITIDQKIKIRIYVMLFLEKFKI